MSDLERLHKEVRDAQMKLADEVRKEHRRVEAERSAHVKEAKAAIEAAEINARMIKIQAAKKTEELNRESNDYAEFLGLETSKYGDADEARSNPLPTRQSVMPQASKPVVEPEPVQETPSTPPQEEPAEPEETDPSPTVVQTTVVVEGDNHEDERDEEAKPLRLSKLVAGTIIWLGTALLMLLFRFYAIFPDGWNAGAKFVAFVLSTIFVAIIATEIATLVYNRRLERQNATR